MNEQRLRRLRHYLACGLLAATATLSGCSVLQLQHRDESTDKRQTPPSPVVEHTSQPLQPEKVGYYMDVQYANLQQKLNGSGTAITRRDQQIIIVIPGGSMFDSDSARIKPVIEPTLSLIAEVLNQYDLTRITVAGHTDGQGDQVYNQLLSEKRAKAVGNYLHRYHIATDRVETLGYGSSQPIADNDTDEGRTQNRRVELLLEPILARENTGNGR